MTGFKNFMIRIMTSKGFVRNDSFVSKIAVSLLQVFLRPVTAAEAFVRNSDLAVSLFYMFIFSSSFSVAVMRLAGLSYILAAEGFVFGAAAYIFICGLTMLSFRFLLKAKHSFLKFISSFTAPATYMSAFLLLSGAGKTDMISFFMTVTAGLLAAVLIHFISLKVMSGQPTERLLVNTIFVYFLALMFAGIVASVIVT